MVKINIHIYLKIVVRIFKRPRKHLPRLKINFKRTYWFVIPLLDFGMQDKTRPNEAAAHAAVVVMGNENR